MNEILNDFKNAWNKPNNAVPQLIIINVVIFLVLGFIRVLSTVAQAEGIFNFLYFQFAIPPIFSDFITRPWTLLTYSFAHDFGGIFHILFNMLFLYWFGKLVVEYLGSQKLINLYVLGALAGSILYLMAYNGIPYYVQRSVNISGMVGASAAVNAILVGAATLLPNYTLFLMFIGPVKLKYIAAFYIVISYLGTIGGNAGGNIAHLGGAAMGYFYVKQLQNGTDFGKWIFTIMQFTKSLFAPQPKIKVSHKRSDRKRGTKFSSGSTKNKRTSSSGDIPNQDEIDAILDKISQKGYESLSKEEKQKLFNASK